MCHPLPPWGGRASSLKPSPWSSRRRAPWRGWSPLSWSMPGHPPRSRRSSPRRRAQVCHTALAWTPRHIRRDRLRRTGHLVIFIYLDVIWNHLNVLLWLLLPTCWCRARNRLQSNTPGGIRKASVGHGGWDFWRRAATSFVGWERLTGTILTDWHISSLFETIWNGMKRSIVK